MNESLLFLIVVVENGSVMGDMMQPVVKCYDYFFMDHIRQLNGIKL